MGNPNSREPSLAREAMCVWHPRHRSGLSNCAPDVNYYVFWAVVGGLIYFQMSAVAATIYENYRLAHSNAVVDAATRRNALIVRTLWFAALPVTFWFSLVRHVRQ